MAIHSRIPNQPTQPNNNPNPQPQVQQVPPTATPQPNNQVGFNWVDPLAGLYSVNQSGSSVVMSQIDEAIQKLQPSKIAPGMHVETILLDKSSNVNLAASVLVIVAIPDYNTVGLSALAYYSLILDASVEGLPSKQESIPDGTVVDIVQTTSDLYDHVMADTIDRKVREYYQNLRTSSGDQYTILSADATVIPKDFDPNNEQMVRAVVVNALLACRTQFAAVDTNYIEMNLGNANYKSSTLVQSTKFGRNTTKDIFDRPIRSDIEITVRATTSNQIGTNSLVVTNTTGYIELLYNKTQAPAYQNRYQYGLPSDVYYQPAFIITSMFNHRVQTLSGILQALINTAAIQANNFWLNSLMPSPSNKDDWHDIGSIGYDIPLNPAEPNHLAKLDTSPDKFNMQALMRLKDVYFHPGLAFMIDIDDCGPSSWMFRPLMLAAMGVSKNGSNNPMDDITRAANNLTDGKFSKHYKGTGNYVYPSYNKILLGTYYKNQSTGTGSQVVERDSRDLDYLAVCSFYGPSDRAMIATYTDSFSSPQHWAKRLYHRNLLTMSALDNISYRGYAERICIENEFIEALLLAASECRYSIVTQTNNVQYGFSSRANANFITSAVMSPTMTVPIAAAGSTPGNCGSEYRSRYN